MSILDCLLAFDRVGPMAFVGVVFAGEDFAAGEKLIVVWRLGASARLRAIYGDNTCGEGEFSGHLRLRRYATVTSRMRAKPGGDSMYRYANPIPKMTRQQEELCIYKPPK